jgi:chromate reductase, NAD(P)H dehydrogenase (quinone)
LKIIAISGALRAHSTNTGLLRAFKKASPSHITFEIATLHGIPLYDGDLEAQSGKPDAVKHLDGLIRAADGVIISTPEYNFSIPGVLKNATDWLSRGGSPFKWKRTGVVGSADGPLGTGRSQYHLRQNLQALEAIVMPKPEMFVGNASSKFNADGDLTDADTQQRIAAWLSAFVDWIDKRP